MLIVFFIIGMIKLILLNDFLRFDLVLGFGVGFWLDFGGWLGLELLEWIFEVCLV